MGDRATLEKIFAIMRRLLLVRMDGLNPIPRKGTTRHECYRALYEIQELLETRRYFGKHLPQTNADQIRAMDTADLAALCASPCPPDQTCGRITVAPLSECEACWIEWLESPEDVQDGT